MNMQTHHSGQISGQVSSQSGTMLPGIPQQSGTAFASQMQNSNIHQNILSMDPETGKMRRYMQQKIWEFLLRRGRQSHEVAPKRMMDIVKRLEEGLCRSAKSKEEYLDLGTLEGRLQSMIKRPLNNHGQQFAHLNSSPYIGTMIPTPGFQHAENSSSVGPASVGSSLVTINGSNSVASGSSLPTRNGSSGIFKGGLAGGYQHLSPVFIGNNGGSNMVTSTGVQNIGSQMIPTPGLLNSSNNKNSTSTNHTTVNIKPSNSFGACVTAESTGASQPMLLKQPLGSQSSRSSHNIGGRMDGGNKSTVQQKSFGLSSGSSAGKLGMGKSTPVTNGPGAKGVNLEGTVHGNFTKALHQQHPQPVLRGDGYEIGVSADDSGSRNLHVPVTSSGSAINNRRLDPVSTESISKGNAYLMANNQSQPQQFQQPLHELQNRQFAQHQVGQHKELQNKLPIRSDTARRPQQSSNIVSEAESGIGTRHHDGGPHSRVSLPLHFSDMRNAHRRDSMEGHCSDTKLLSHSSDPQNVRISPTQASEKVQQVGANKSNLLDAALHSEKYSKSEDAADVSGSIPPELNIQDEFRQRISGHDVAQLNKLSSEESVIVRCDSSRSAEPSKINDGILRSQKWLLFLKHARKCSASETKCREPNCLAVQELWKHLEQCEADPCPQPKCRASKVLVAHHMKCQDGKCPVCVPVKNFVQERKSLGRSNLNSGSTSSANLSCKSLNNAEIMQKSTPMAVPVVTETEGDQQPSLKRLKTERSCQPHVSGSECNVALASSVKDFQIQETQDPEQHHDHCQIKSEFTEVKMEVDESVGQLSPSTHDMEIKKESLDASCVPIPEGNPVAPNNTVGVSVPEAMKTEKETVHPKLESTPMLSENAPKLGKTKVQAVSMVELFTVEQVQEHIASLRQWIGQSKAKAGRNQAMGNLISENSCQLCGVERLAFEPVPMYCTPCGVRIKRNAMYYTCGSGETRYFFCIPCYNNEARGDTIVVDGGSIPKSRFEKKKNDEETDEWWVQCDKCEAWQHQICALFNGRRNEGGQAEYTCPNCYIAEVQRGERVPLLQSAVLGAKDLPSTNLSDHLEQRLFVKLKEERQDRARVQGRSYDEVPGAEELVVRVVSSVDKKLDVKPRFHEIFRDQNDHPTEFPYKSKVILLFQRIEGVEVCLFGMYVQEYGSECPQPNHRRVYLSYLDSVKYFRPDIKVVTGEALRTFVYHEILIGYLEHCKMRGFTSCYIWACPPLKGEDYILYCHPEIQKTPKSDKLREWYLAMLRKASQENIVVDLTNLYDHFFVSNGECKAKVTAARLPYFDGDYWPGAAEDFIWVLQQEDAERKQPKKGGAKKSSTKRALKASGQTELSGNASKDLILMRKLGEAIFPMREDFIMVHLQHSCSHCCSLMVSGTHWVCRLCKNFQLCDKCYDAEKVLEDKERHPINQKTKHALYPMEITGVPDDTKENEILESEFFDTRQAFLNLSQGNHYQYDTLRRAKHSSMMILYHLHNPTAPALVTQCATCHLDIEAGHVWRCETCLDYDVCNTCYQKNGGKDHLHKLTNQKSSDDNAQNQEARQLRVLQLRKMLDLLVHAAQCRSTHCQYPNCRKVKALFRHGMKCQTRASGGCQLCKKMWYLLQIHARACKESQCQVPRCKDLRLHLKRLQQQSDSRRRAAVTEMMRQRSAEVRRNS